MHRWRRLGPKARWAFGLATLFVLGLILFYFVPGTEGSPHGTATHDLGDAAREALTVTVVCGLMLRFVVLPRDDDRS